MLTIFTYICLISLTNQQMSVQAQLNKALNNVVAGKCWKQQHVNWLTFSATSTRTAQAPTPDPCVAVWQQVQTLWNKNNQNLDKLKNSFAKAMNQQKVCKSRRIRRLQAGKKPECKKSSQLLENETWEYLRRLLQDRGKSRALSVLAKAVKLTHQAPTLTQEQPYPMALSSRKLFNNPLAKDCQWKNKLMVFPALSLRRAQAPRPKPDPKCQKALEDVLGSRKLRVNQVNNLLYQAAAANCNKPSRRLLRMMGFKNQYRELNLSHKCDTAEMAVKQALSYLTASERWRDW